jgi:hypothetical protein
MIVKTSDLIKAVGFLAIYWGYLELEIDTLLKFSAPIVPMPLDNGRNAITMEKFLERSFRNRVEYLKKRLLDRCDIVRPYPELTRERHKIESALSECTDVSLQRNEVMHSAIYSQSTGGTVQRERLSGATEAIDAQTVCDLANHIFSLGGGVFALQIVAHRLMNAPLKLT